MPGIAVVTFMPELGDLDTRQHDRGLERDQTERLCEPLGKVGRQGRNTVRLRRHDGAGNKTRNPQQDVGRRDGGGQNPVRVRCAACPVSDPVTRMWRSARKPGRDWDFDARG